MDENRNFENGFNNENINQPVTPPISQPINQPSGVNDGGLGFKKVGNLSFGPSSENNGYIPREPETIGMPNGEVNSQSPVSRTNYSTPVNEPEETFTERKFGDGVPGGGFGKCAKSNQCGRNFPFGRCFGYGCGAADPRLQQSAVPPLGPGDN